MSADLDLARHDLIKVCGGDPEHLVLWVAADASIVATVDRLRPSDMPTTMPVAAVLGMVASGSWRVEVGEPPLQRLDHKLSEADLMGRERSFAIVRSVVDGNVPDVFSAGPRGRLITRSMQLHGVSRPTVLEALRRYSTGA